YNLFPRKKREDDDRIVGSNEGGPGTGSLSIANKEKRNIVQKALTLPPSRNDALIWLARTFTENQEFGEAAGLINILQNDRNLPARLKNDLAEVNSFWFYSQNNYDSAAYYLERALSNSDTKQDKSRSEFLLAQLYEMTGQFDKASSYYAKASKHTVDPVMDIYARLNDAKMMRNAGNFKELDKSIANLLKMAKKDKFEAYRDVIYYSAAQLTLQKPDTVTGLVNYKKSIRYTGTNPLYRNKSYLQLANIAYSQGKYKEAHAYYDSLQLTDKELGLKEGELEERKTNLTNLVQAINAIEREDSLQRIAAMDPAERDALIKKLVKKYRKEMGLKEEDNFTGNSIITFNNRSEPIDLFAAPTKGEWYFYNTSLRSKGLSEFKNKWGKRSNVDNWRRKTASEAVINKNLSVGTDIDAIPVDPLKSNVPSGPVEYTYDALMANIPLSPEKIDTSNIIIASNMIVLAKVFQDDLRDYDQAIATYLDFLQRFPGNKAEAEAYLGLFFSYTKIGNTSRAAFYKNLLATKYAGSTYNAMLSNPSALEPGKQSPEANSRYENIYNMFIEGRFAEALAAKNQADSLYGRNYWTPQLLYIESMYYIRERNDSIAIATLTNLQTIYPASPLKAKAATMIDVLKRRAEIENYLTNLQVTRAIEDTVMVSDDKALVIEKKPVVTAPVVKKAEQVQKPVNMLDSSIKAPAAFV
ncbi:MAG TPA: tetratricopeptide repeat protein, partial [Ferruginibacter sp.]|nr:tetratricopeptide repeat protein [Ferruginibacter sp.]